MPSHVADTVGFLAQSAINLGRHGGCYWLGAHFNLKLRFSCLKLGIFLEWPIRATGAT